MWVIVISSALFDVEVIGLFQTVEQARFFEDRHVDAPEGATADFVKITSAAEYTAAQSAAGSEGRG